MNSETNWWLLLPAPVRRLPADLAAVLLGVGLTSGAVFLPGVNQTPLRVLIGLPFVLFIPGYAFIAALFPEGGSSEEDTEAAQHDPKAGIDGIERVALSFGTSIALVPLIGLVLNFTPWGIRLVPIIVSISAVTVGFTAVAARRRWALSEDERFHVPYREWLKAVRKELLEPDSRTDGALNVLLVMSVLLATASVGYAVAVPKQGESFTELYLLTETEDGELVADNYPTEFTAGEPRSLIVGIGNQEHERVTYTLVVELQRVQIQNNTTRVRQQRELRRFSPTLDANETWQRQHTITPQLTGTRLRLIYLLYKGPAAENPRMENAYREVHLWVNVSAPAATASVQSPTGSPVPLR